MTNVKWLTAITAVDAPFRGYQQTGSYLLRQHEDEPGLPVTRIMARALMIPPGIPDFFTRARQVGGVTFAWPAGRGRASLPSPPWP